MVNLYRQDGETLYGIKEYIVDTPADISDVRIEKTLRPGSLIFVISTSEKYMLNGEKKWVKISFSSGGTESETTRDNAGSLITF